MIPLGQVATVINIRRANCCIYVTANSSGRIASHPHTESLVGCGILNQLIACEDPDADPIAIGWWIFLTTTGLAPVFDVHTEHDTARFLLALLRGVVANARETDGISWCTARLRTTDAVIRIAQPIRDWGIRVLGAAQAAAKQTVETAPVEQPARPGFHMAHMLPLAVDAQTVRGEWRRH